MKPNIIFILIDDMGYKDLSCYGSTFYETPNIDKLAADGVFFTDAYASCPVCSPSRASILTGKYPARLGLTNFIGGHRVGKLIDAPYIRQLPLEEYALPKALKQGGYSTWQVGKWHLGEKEFYPEKHGFDVNIGGCHMGHPYNGYFSPWNIENLENGEDDEYLTDCLTDKAINLIEQNNDNPFFLYFSCYAVHTPIQAKPDDVKRFEEKAKRMKLDEINPLVEGEVAPAENPNKKRVTRRVLQSSPEYAAMIYNLDLNIGRIVEKLKEKNIYDDTIIIFTSDNGGLATSEGSPTCNFPLAEGKGWMYDGGVREPLIIKTANNNRGVCSTPVIGTDFYPTLLEYAELDPLPDQHKDGVSLVSLIEEGVAPTREALYWHYPHYGNQGGTPGAAVRMGEYKLIKFFEDNHTELYNLKDDISEVFNLADKLPNIAKRMEDNLDNWIKEVGGLIPQKNDKYVDITK